MTLLELTVVILVLLSLISILFVGARAWKKGSDRAGCILNIRNTQQAVRGYMNMNNGSIPAIGVLFGTDGYLKQPICPSDPDKAYASSYALDTATSTAAGAVFLKCQIDATTHKPDTTMSADW